MRRLHSCALATHPARAARGSKWKSCGARKDRAARRGIGLPQSPAGAWRTQPLWAIAVTSRIDVIWTASGGQARQLGFGRSRRTCTRPRGSDASSCGLLLRHLCRLWAANGRRPCGCPWTPSCPTRTRRSRCPHVEMRILVLLNEECHMSNARGMSWKPLRLAGRRSRAIEPALQYFFLPRKWPLRGLARASRWCGCAGRAPGKAAAAGRSAAVAARVHQTLDCSSCVFAAQVALDGEKFCVDTAPNPGALGVRQLLTRGVVDAEGRRRST